MECHLKVGREGHLYLKRAEKRAWSNDSFRGSIWVMTQVPTTEEKKVNNWAVIKTYGAAARTYPLLLALPFIGALIIQGAALGAPLYLQRFINVLSDASPEAQVTGVLFGILGMFALMSFIGWCGQRVQMLSIMALESRVMADLSNSAFANLLGHSHNFFISNFAGSLTRKVSRYARAFEQLFDTFIFGFFSTAIFTIGVIFVLSQRSPILGIALLVWVVIFIGIQILMARVRQPLRVARSKEDSKVTGILSDAVSNQSIIQTFASGKHEKGLFGSAVEAWRAATIRSWNADALIFAVQGLFAIAIEIVLLGGGILLWQQGAITVGDFVLIQVYIIGVMDRVWGVGNSLRRLYDAFADAHEMIVIFDTPYEIADAPNAKTLSVTEGSINLENIGFHFSAEQPVLRDFNLQIKGGEKVALVGPSGAGKSTVTKLLLRFYDISSGRISIDGQDVRDVTQDSLHEAISFVPQDPTLFHRSLMDNIRYGDPQVTDDEVIEAAKKAHCHEFISRLPEGYGTQVGERGVKLSGGERQRVAIARAILKNAPILVLDEATSALDSESEHLIQDALKVLMEGKTVIVIAHRLSTIMTMDRIIVVEAGRIAAEGTHKELLDQEGGLYHKLWSIQAGSFVADT